MKQLMDDTVLDEFASSTTSDTDEPLTELFGFGKKKRIQCIIVVADFPNMSDYSLMEISKNVEEALKTDNKVQDLQAFYHDADSLPVAKEAYSGRAKTVFMYTCATHADYDAIEARVKTWALDGFVWSSRVDYGKKLHQILHFDIVLPEDKTKRTRESLEADDWYKQEW